MRIHEASVGRTFPGSAETPDDPTLCEATFGPANGVHFSGAVVCHRGERLRFCPYVLVELELVPGDLEEVRPAERVRFAAEVRLQGVEFLPKYALLQVVDTTAPEGAVTSELDLGKTILSTPSIAHGGIFVRSDGKLWRLAQLEQRSGG